MPEPESVFYQVILKYLAQLIIFDTSNSFSYYGFYRLPQTVVLVYFCSQ